MVTLTPMFSAYRTVAEYLKRYYYPAADNYKRRAANGSVVAKQILEWTKKIEQEWDSVSIMSRTSVLREGAGLNEKSWEIGALVHLGRLTPSDVVVEIFADVVSGCPFRMPMSAETCCPQKSGEYEFKGLVPAGRNSSDYTVRVIPRHSDVIIPLETNRIVWEA